MEIGITGGTGFIGTHLVEKLTDRGHTLTCLVRSTSNLSFLKEKNISVCRGDVMDPDSLKPFVENKDIIFHMAGRIKGIPEEMYRVNVEGTRNILAATDRYNKKTKRFFFMSSLEAAGINPGNEPFTEERELEPLTNYGKSKADAEKVITQEFPHIPWTAMRPGPVYGPWDREFFQMFRIVSKGWLPRPAAGSRISMIYVENLVEAMINAVLSPQAACKAYYIADQPWITWDAFGDIVEKILGIKLKRLAVPVAGIKLLGTIMGIYNRVARNPALLTKEKFSVMLQENLTVSTTRAETDFGFSSPVGLEESIRRTMEWYFEQGWLKPAEKRSRGK